MPGEGCVHIYNIYQPALREPNKHIWIRINHIPIHTVFNFSPAPAPAVKRWDWANTDWQAYRSELANQLQPIIGQLARPITINAAVEDLVEALTTAAETAMPKKTITEYSKPGYTEKIKKLKHRMQQTKQ
ncbi:uncharacterized protein BO66DRAFT_402101 [Aspergillus aculeatinus CBS 121060]|uniref:Uncharacterized protein n=1 Tax=Aspergillus aculeatinus CBS 121060 TaxID=1448322 RepID=A0ACD1H776_9EURO|nr:hypothetical protein BO66DRAFT_402101 [Aspergillus aculeatinus CBS 121060]RAH69444.1 hypothetical protein BO66DRAFT_402101 [Aspergillus aculeatinus CBS 121060]